MVVCARGLSQPLSPPNKLITERKRSVNTLALNVNVTSTPLAMDATCIHPFSISFERHAHTPTFECYKG